MDSLEYIDSYFGGEFSPGEAGRFEKRIQDDPVFANEVALYLGTLAASRETRVQQQKARFGQLYRDRSGQAPVRKMPLRQWASAVAAAVILAIIAWIWLLLAKPANPTQLAQGYIHQNLEVLPAKMGGADPVQTGIDLYNKGRFADALQQFNTILQTDSLHPTALLNAGIVSLRMENYDKALESFLKLEKHTDPHVNPALFYEALTLMKRNHPGDSGHAKQLLTRIVRQDGNRKEDAQQLLSKM
jgi:tetratricopeptide (TPR) repeat protein